MPDTIVFDLETQKGFDEIPSRNDLHLLGVSVLCAYSYDQEKFYSFEEKDLKHFGEMIKKAGLVIGFNIKGFDLPVLAPYVSFDLFSLPVLDMMDDVVAGAGFRISLDNLCQTTLGSKKSAHGLDAIRWWREGKMDEIKKYCIDDVRLTRDLFEFGKKNGHVMFFSRDQMDKLAIPVRWAGNAGKDARQVLGEALKNKRSVEIDYVTRASDAPGPLKKTRLVDVYKIDKDFFEGYCHLRKGLRVFKIDRVLSARLTEGEYEIPGSLPAKLL